MRFGIAIVTLVLSAIMLLLGIGQRTFLAGPSEIVYSASIDVDTGFAVIPGEVLQARPGQANVVVKGEAAFAATGSGGDVAAWVALFAHVELGADTKAAALVASPVAAVAEAEEERGDGTPSTGSDSAAADPESQGGEGEQAEGEVEADAETSVLDPRGSDLWFEERGIAPKPAAEDAESTTTSATSATPERASVRLPVSIDDDDAVLVSVDGSSTVANEVSVVWVQDRRTPFAGPLLAVGGVLALIGALLYLLAVDHDRRGLGPRRGRKGPLLGIRDAFSGMRGSRRGASDDAPKDGGRASTRVTLPVIGLAVVLGLSGCSAEYWPDLSPEPAVEVEEDDGSAVAPIPLTRAQLDRIVADIAAVAGDADDDFDATLLEGRFAGDALAQRVANYKIRDAVPDYAVVPPRITDEALGYELVQSTEGWPRTVFVTVASEVGTAKVEPDAVESEAEAEAAEEAEKPSDDADAASPSLALIMTQAGPHENYLVSRVVSLRGGISMPEAAPAEEGTALLGDDLQTLVLAPGEVGAAYAAVLTGGTDVEEAELFDLTGDTLIERSGAAWARQSQETADAAGQGVTYSVSAKQSDTKIVSLSTGVGGALVATTVLEDRIEEPSSGRWKPTPPASVTALSGLSGQQDRLVSEVAHQLLFYVPGKGSDAPIQLLGFSSGLVGARN